MHLIKILYCRFIGCFDNVPDSDGFLCSGHKKIIRNEYEYG